MDWINVNEKLPPDGKDWQRELYLVTVTCASWSKPQTLVMEWERKTIRGKMTKRWLWRDRIKMDAWMVTHWMPLPEPYESKC